MALVDAEEAASKREQMGAEEEVRVGQVRALLRAAAGGDEARIVQLLADGVDVNAADAEGDTALGLAAEHGHVECATLLLANGADFTQIPTAQWSYEQVGLWFNEAFEPWFEVKYSAHLQAAQIDGEALLALDEAALRDDLGVYLGSHRRVILKELASRAEQDEVTSARRLLVAEEEREQLRERLAKEGEARREREENLLDASRKHEIKTLELAWKATVVSKTRPISSELPTRQTDRAAQYPFSLRACSLWFAVCHSHARSISLCDCLALFVCRRLLRRGLRMLPVRLLITSSLAPYLQRSCIPRATTCGSVSAHQRESSNGERESALLSWSCYQCAGPTRRCPSGPPSATGLCACPFDDWCCCRVDAWEGEPVSALKLALQKITGLAPTQQSLTFRFKELAPTLRLGSYNIPVSPRGCVLVEELLLLRADVDAVAQDNSVLELKRVAGGSGRSNILLQSLRK